MIGNAEQAVLEIDELGRDVEGDDLAAAIAQQLLAERDAAQEQAAFRSRLALADDVGILAEGLAGKRQGEQRRPVILRQSRVLRPPAQQGAEGMNVNHKPASPQSA